MNREIKYKLKIADKQEPGEGRRRVQDINFYQAGILDSWENKTSNYPSPSKDWFNKQFSEPQPVKCNNCIGGISVIGEIEEACECELCGGKSIRHYQSFWYDKETPDIIMSNPEIMVATESDLVFSVVTGMLFKGKYLQIVVNPWVELLN